MPAHTWHVHMGNVSQTYYFTTIHRVPVCVNNFLLKCTDVSRNHKHSLVCTDKTITMTYMTFGIWSVKTCVHYGLWSGNPSCTLY